MKKLLLTLVALVAAMSMSAQVLTVMKGDETIKVYKSSEADKFYFGEIEYHESVDLGLSVKWATTNIGAKKPSDLGNYFAWGDTRGYALSETHSFNWANCPFNNGSSSYNATYFNSVKNTVCPNGTLAPEYDVAAKNWGGTWRMPTKAEFDELINNCTWVPTTINGVTGYKVTSNKEGYTDKFIFLPGAGYRDNTTHGDSTDNYWTSTLSETELNKAYHFVYNSVEKKTVANNRIYGISIRAVCPKE